ncbi:MAG: DUF6273 domain-containing protein [Bacteroidales bacterium]|nr:DUF6273 domain-containing protein [Bacteroidales bacterium]
MKHVTHFATLLAALSLMAASTSCSSMLTALSESISQINDQLASNLSENPQSTQPQATTKAASATTTTASASAAKTMPSSEFAGTPYTVLPAGTDGSIGKSGKYVLFGDWPQTIKAENVTVNESKYVVVGAHTYYEGSDGCWYIKIMENKASGYEGPRGFRYSDGTKVQNKYKKSYRYFKVEPIKWRILTSNYNGTGKKLLLAEVALTCEPFNDTWGDYAMFEGIDGTQHYFTLDVTLRQLKDGSYIQHNNYEHSRIRAFLNGIAYLQGDENAYVKGTPPVTRTNDEFVGRGFLQTAFSPEAQSKIATTTVDNSSRKNAGLSIVQELTVLDAKIYEGNLYYEKGENHKRTYFPKFTSNNTKDKVFLLTPADVIRKDYGFTEVPPKVTPDNAMNHFFLGKTWKASETSTTYKGQRRTLTDFTRAHGALHFDDEISTFWWLRTPILPPYFHRITVERTDQQAAIVNDFPSPSAQEVNSTGVGVVPAICVN